MTGKHVYELVRIGLVLFAAEEFVPVDAMRFQPERLDADVVVMAVAGRHDALVVVPGVPVSALGDMDWRGAVSAAAAGLMSGRADGVGFAGIVDACDALRAIYGDVVFLTVGVAVGVTGRFGFDWYPELRKALEDACLLGTGPARSVVEHDGKPDATAASTAPRKAHDAQAEDFRQPEFLTYTFADGDPAPANQDGPEEWYRKGLRAEEHDKDWPKAASWYRKAAEAGHMKAQCRLGELHRLGLLSKMPDLRSAEHWYRMAAEQGDTEGQCGLGEVLANTSRDREAVQWYRKAAERGNCDAQYHLAECYEKGRGVEIDLEQAVHWYRKAADHGVGHTQHKAAYRLGDLYENHRDADGWSGKPAKENPGRNGALGFMYRHSSAGKSDAAQAVHWYRKAVELDSDPKDSPSWGSGSWRGFAERGVARLTKRYPDLA